MRKPLPIIHEDTDSLKQRVQHEHNGRKQPRLQMLYWLASGQAQTRLGMAQLLGVHRNTVGHWLALYESGGLDVLLSLHVPDGKPLSLPPDVLAALKQALQQQVDVVAHLKAVLDLLAVDIQKFPSPSCPPKLPPETEGLLSTTFST